MKSRKMIKKLLIKKETISNLELKDVHGGTNLGIAVKTKTQDYSECGTGPVTIAPCMCVTMDYSQCGTGPATIMPCMCK